MAARGKPKKPRAPKPLTGQAVRTIAACLTPIEYASKYKTGKRQGFPDYETFEADLEAIPDDIPRFRNFVRYVQDGHKISSATTLAGYSSTEEVAADYFYHPQHDLLKLILSRAKECLNHRAMMALHIHIQEDPGLAKRVLEIENPEVWNADKLDKLRDILREFSKMSKDEIESFVTAEIGRGRDSIALPSPEGDGVSRIRKSNTR